MVGRWRRPLVVVDPGSTLAELLIGVGIAAVVGVTRAVIAGLGWAFAAGWRYRSTLAPVYAGVVLAYTAGYLHDGYRWWAFPVWGLCVAVAAFLALVPRGWVLRFPMLWHRIERAYLCTAVLAAGGWLGAGVWYGPATRPLPLLGLVSGGLLALPWWVHRRRRARVRIDRLIEAWPGVGQAAGLAGSRVVSVVVTGWGWAARIALPAGMTARTATGRIGELESALGARPGSVRVEPDRRRADDIVLRVVETDPHATPIRYPGTAPSTIGRPATLGLFEDASPVLVEMLGRHVLIGGATGSGKSGVVNLIVASLVAMSDTVIWGIDLKGGMELGPWRDCLGRLATTPNEATEVLHDAVAELDARTVEQADRTERIWRPSLARPALIVMVEEYAELSDAAIRYVDSGTRRGRAVAVQFVMATQRPTQKTMGEGSAIRSQADIRIALRVAEAADADLILDRGSVKAGWTAHTLDAPGKFLIRSPEHSLPRPARAYQVTDDDVRRTVATYAARRPTLPPRQQSAGPRQAATVILPPEFERGQDHGQDEVLAVLRETPGGVSITDLTAKTGLSRATVYRRMRELRTAGLVQSAGPGRWAATGGDPHTP